MGSKWKAFFYVKANLWLWLWAPPLNKLRISEVWKRCKRGCENVAWETEGLHGEGAGARKGFGWRWERRTNESKGKKPLGGGFKCGRWRNVSRRQKMHDETSTGSGVTSFRLFTELKSPPSKWLRLWFFTWLWAFPCSDVASVWACQCADIIPLIFAFCVQIDWQGFPLSFKFSDPEMRLWINQRKCLYLA